MIVIVNYGLGNIQAFANVYKRLNIPFSVATRKDELKNASKIIIPGVGSFDHAIKLLQQSGMRKQLDKLVLEEGIPVIGICVGMQILAQSSEEGVLPGLGWVDGEVKKIDTKFLNHRTHLPHMGWNTVNHVNGNGLFSNLPSDPRFYFLHSFFLHCHNHENIIATSRYGIEFACAVNSENIYGVQFHPEKSHSNGIQILKNFANLNSAKS